MSAIERLDMLLQVVQSAVVSARACMDAIANGRNLRARLHRLRGKIERVRRVIKRVDAIEVPDTAECLNKMLIGYRLGLVELSTCCAHLLDWFSTQDVASNEMLADRLTGVCWRRDRDPVLLAGKNLRGLAVAMSQVGVKRVILVDPALREDEIPGVFAVPDTHQLRGAVLQYTANRPHYTLRWRGQGVTDEEWRVADEGVQDALDSVRLSSNTIDVFGAVWVKQGLTNYPIIARSPKIGMLARSGAFFGKPLVIVSPGPSLSKNVHLLHQIKGHAVIMTCSHAVAALAKAGIVPDIVLALDPEDLRYHFTGYDTAAPEAMFFGATIHPGAMRVPAKRLFTFAPNVTNDGWIHGMWDSMIPTGGSVACTELGIGVQWGCNPIVFVGQDLAYTGNRVYTDGSVDEHTVIKQADDGTHVIGGWSKAYSEMATVMGQREKQEPVEIVRAWDGESMVPSSDLFGVYRRWISDVSRRYKERSRVYNCTEGGSYIEGATHVPLSEMLPVLTSQRCDVGALLDEATAQFDPAAEMRATLTDLEGKVSDLESTEALAQECASLAKTVGGDGVVPPRLLVAGELLEKKLNDRKMRYVILAYQGQLGQYDDIDPDDDEANNACAVENYERMIAATAEYLPMARRSAEEIRASIAASTTRAA